MYYTGKNQSDEVVDRAYWCAVVPAQGHRLYPL